MTVLRRGSRITASKTVPSANATPNLTVCRHRGTDAIDPMCGPADDLGSGPSGPHSRNLCRTPDEADAEDEHAEGQQHCTDLGEINEPVRSFGSGRQNREEKARRNQDRSNGSRTPHKPFHGVGEVRLIHVAEHNERATAQKQQESTVRLALPRGPAAMCESLTPLGRNAVGTMGCKLGESLALFLRQREFASVCDISRANFLFSQSHSSARIPGFSPPP
jgi:hypothetical protein